MTFLRVLLTFALSVSLGFLPISAHVARTGGFQSLVICSDDGARTVLLDAEGKEVPADAHACTDCCLVFATVPVALVAGSSKAEFSTVWQYFQSLSVLPQSPRILPQNRAPPVLI